MGADDRERLLSRTARRRDAKKPTRGQGNPKSTPPPPTTRFEEETIKHTSNPTSNLLPTAEGNPNEFKLCYKNFPAILYVTPG